MPLRTILFLAIFFACCGGALFVPVLGVMGYVLHYCTGPEAQWWSLVVRGWGIRFSYVLAAVTAVGLVLNYRRLAPGKLLVGQEKLILVFLGVVWLSVVLNKPIMERYTVIDHPTVKMTKVVLFTLMLSHIAVRRRQLDWVLWALVIGSLALGWEAYTAEPEEFASGRLERVGGPDFRDANHLGGFLAAMIPIIGTKFLQSGWRGKLLCAASGALAMNAIVLTRSRGAFLGLVATAVVTVILAPRVHRYRILIAAIVAGAGFFYLTDVAFRQRTATITRTDEEQDYSTQRRLEVWRAGLEMMKDHPFGVGAGNFTARIGAYAPKHAGLAAHSTYIQSGTELGVQGWAVLGAAILNAAAILRRVIRRTGQLAESQRAYFLLAACGLGAALAGILTYGVFGNMLYIESLWWLLAMPVCLQRSLDNSLGELPPAPTVEPKPPRKHFWSGRRRAAGRT